MTKPGQVILQAPDGAWFRFTDLSREILASTPADVPSAVGELEEAVASGLWVAGYVAYEASAGFDDALTTQPPVSAMPAMWFGVYEQTESLASLPPATGTHIVGPWESATSEEDYRAAIDTIRRYIYAGDTYQVNYTLRLRAPFSGDPYGLFVNLCRAQNAGHCAFVDLGDCVICSASPELFFRLEGNRVVSRPMKGTAARGYTQEQDLQQIERLQGSEKNRAENIMIVDMIRNDLGRVAEAGSVHVTRRFDVERYPTVLQMTSTVESRTEAGIGEILNALFPCASITGAPKVRAMQIIRELESEPRGVYTGAIGYVAPDRAANFNVAIRTVCVNRAAGVAEYGVGGGIVWDSEGTGEYAECLQKARVLTAEVPDFRLLETLRWTAEEGYFLLERHLARMSDSMSYFAYPDATATVRHRLTELASAFAGPQRVRVLAARDGTVEVEATPLDVGVSGAPWRLGIAPGRVNADDVFLYHKTTHRRVYEQARASCPGLDDALLVNGRGEVTETTVGNLVACMEGEWVTPPVSCGLLAGTFRAELMEEGMLSERVLVPDDLAKADELQVVNSVRGRIVGRLCDRAPQG